MKRWCVGVALSVAAHGAVVIVAVSAGTPPVRPRKPDTAVAVVPTPPPIAVELLATPVVHAGGARHGARGGAHIPTAMHVERGAPVVESAPPAVAAPVATASPQLPSPWAAALPDLPAAAPVPEAPPLHDRAFSEGTSTFTMHVAPDGSAHLDDRSNLQFALHAPSRHEIADAIERDHTSEMSPPDDTERSNADEAKMPPMGATILTFDVTDWAMRRHGQDPYASRKLQMLDATRDERAMIGAKFREQQVAQTPQLVRENIERVAALPVTERKQALFELWNECDQTSAGEIARAAIATYLRAHYAPDELAAIR